MTSQTKTCLHCHTIVDSKIDVCPKCQGTVFQANPVDKTIGWSPENTEDTLRLISFPSNEEKPKTTKAVKPKAKKRVFVLKKMYRKYKKKRQNQQKKQTDSFFAKIKAYYRQLPSLTKKLLWIVGALVLVCVLTLGLFLNKPKKTKSSAASPTPTPSSTSITQSARPDGLAIGKLKINNNTVINIRVLPSLAGTIIGTSDPTKEYDVYAIEDTSEYTWYQIGPDAWIADGDDWVTYEANS